MFGSSIRKLGTSKPERGKPFCRLGTPKPELGKPLRKLGTAKPKRGKPFCRVGTPKPVLGSSFRKLGTGKPTILTGSGDREWSKRSHPSPIRPQAARTTALRSAVKTRARETGLLDCGGKRSATPLFRCYLGPSTVPQRRRRYALPAHSKKPPVAGRGAAEQNLERRVTGIVLHRNSQVWFHQGMFSQRFPEVSRARARARPAA
jgi:hypothetical protein